MGQGFDSKAAKTFFSRAEKLELAPGKQGLSFGAPREPVEGSRPLWSESLCRRKPRNGKKPGVALRSWGEKTFSKNVDQFCTDFCFQSHGLLNVSLSRSRSLSLSLFLSLALFLSLSLAAAEGERARILT
jgi:hypothetical protein